MVSPSFATQDELKTFVQDDLDDDLAEQLVSGTSDMIRGYCRQQIDFEAGDQVTVDPIGLFAFLPEIPVTAISEVQVRGSDGSWTTLAEDVDYLWSSDGIIESVHSYGWPTARSSVKVTYDHGFEEIPGDLRQVCLQIAARSAGNPMNRQGVTVGGIREMFQRDVHGVSDLLATEQVVLGRYTAPVIT